VCATLEFGVVFLSKIIKLGLTSSAEYEERCGCWSSSAQRNRSYKVSISTSSPAVLTDGPFRIPGYARFRYDTVLVFFQSVPPRISHLPKYHNSFHFYLSDWQAAR
jgi:hypothetical protein